MVWVDKYILIFAGWFILPGCCKSPSWQQQNRAMAEEKSQAVKMSSKDLSQLPGGAAAKPEQDLNQIAPGTCRIVGKIVQILPEREADKNTPCGKAPCKALLQLQNVIGYGTGFIKPLAPEQEIKVFFSFTLQATEKLFPELHTPLPGVQVGDTILTDLQSITEHAASEAHLYKINLYKVL